jgi:hypothetical protein
VGALLFGAASVQAETKPGPKALVGGALLGAEFGTSAAALSDAEPWWVYLVAGAGASSVGALGGYYADRADDPRLSTLILAGGMALAIPAAVLVIDATVFRERLDYVQDQPPLANPSEDAQTSIKRSSPRRHGKRRTARSSAFEPTLLGLDGDGLRLGLPNIEFHHVYSEADLFELGVAQLTEIRFEVFQCRF